MNNKQLSLLIIGCGDLGTRLGIKMANKGWQVYGARRDISQLPKEIVGINLNLYQQNLPINWPQHNLDYIVYCVAPSKGEHDRYYDLYYKGLENTLHWLQLCQQMPKRLFVVSSTAVYAQNDGQWLDENSPTTPNNTQGKTMLAMEQLALHSKLNYTCVRLSGIYGPNRTYLINQAKQGVHYPNQPPLYANRIHIDDAANLIQQLIEYQQMGNTLNNCYIGVDDNPAPIQETLAWIRSKLNITALADEYSERRVGSKRLSNKLAKTTGWKPNYASYQEGYDELLG
ncbi:NAD-dependent epimerase/dehydratase family protein [Entomomonas asaccharolytica]|uniref:NAD-dependent epimerase/dehydratase family protein n=1 Tax=Entomomonas asaccharolytica TaxID=2785331 RepID=A0A974RXY9_9GAMM|nr:NAD-dependent epimerase/dehydratase family protein [Entomomonas asaccharolytica]QQP86705.1 NAD-dependent epimerase/dehydratase family protein [Entomomonas asaccharolytica]